MADLAAAFYRSSAAFNLRTILAAARSMHGPLLIAMDDAEVMGAARAAILLLRGLPLNHETLLGLHDDQIEGGRLQ